MSKVDEKMVQKLRAITAKTYAEQAKWFLNGFWEEKGVGAQEAENCWGYVQTCAELDLEKHERGCDLDEFAAHRFLEKLGETLTVQAMRNKLREIDVDFNKRMALLEFLMFKHQKNIPDIVNAPQGEDKEGIARAQAMVNDAQKAVESLLQRLEEQKAAEAASVAAEKEAKTRAEHAQHELAKTKEAEEEVRKAEAHQKKTLAELEAQQKAFQEKCADLEKKSQEGSTVSKGRATAELAQLQATDPLPLRTARINQEAAVRKVEKARQHAEHLTKLSEEAAAAAETARQAASKAVEEAAAARVAVEGAVKEAEASFQKAIDFLEEAKKKPGHSHGDFWWMEREIQEKKKYLPRSKQ